MAGGFSLLRNMFGTEGRTPIALRRLKLTMPENIRHLRTEDRKIISRMMKDNKPKTEIARTIRFSLGTILPRIKICGKGIFPLVLRHPIMLGLRND